MELGLGTPTAKWFANLLEACVKVEKESQPHSTPLFEWLWQVYGSSVIRSWRQAQFHFHPKRERVGNGGGGGSAVGMHGGRERFKPK